MANSSVDIALDVISEILGPATAQTLRDGLPDGSNSEWEYDEKLVREIGLACHLWAERQANATKRR
jgi:hypothetical protein